MRPPYGNTPVRRRVPLCVFVLIAVIIALYARSCFGNIFAHPALKPLHLKIGPDGPRAACIFLRASRALTAISQSGAIKNVAEPMTTLTDQPTALRQMITEKQVLAAIPIARSTLQQWIKAGAFPAPMPIGQHRVAWFQDDVVQWQAAQDAKRRRLS